MPSQCLSQVRITHAVFYRLLGGCLAAGVLCGCATPVSIRATAYDIHLQLDPATHRVHGETTITLRCEPSPGLGGGSASVDFALNRALQVADLKARGVHVRAHTSHKPPVGEGGKDADTEALLTIHNLVLDAARPEFTLTFTYAGELFQDVQAGEKPGQIHNLMMAAHVSPEGIFLDAGGGWYPSTYHDPAHPQGELASYRLTAEPVAGMELVAGARLDPDASQRSGKLVWAGQYPLDGMVLAGGPHQIKERQVGPVHLALHYSSPNDPQSRAAIEKNTELFLTAATDYLKRYPPLIGPYPFEHYTIVENFFSSGFAFPEFTLLNKVLLQMGPRALMHGYLDHEMLHCWWGNSIYVDPADGNWCEALTSYAANYYGYVLDGDETGARNQRRNNCVAVSRLKPEDDKPLGTFGRPNGPSRDVGYAKGAMVFHMLARQVGQDNFWAVLRQLTQAYTGKYASWQTLQKLFEQQSQVKLDRFFEQWVRAGGAPRLELSKATWRSSDQTLDVSLTQSQNNFVLVVPLRAVYADGTQADQMVDLAGPSATVHLRLDRQPESVVLDPDYHILRKLRPDEIIPSSATTRAGRNLLVAKPAGAVSKFYQRVIEDFSREPAAKEVTQREPGQINAAELARQSVLVLGDAVRSEPVQALLARTSCPVTWTASAFSLDGVLYDQPGQAVLCTVHHPDVPEGGLTIYYGNSETALGRSDLLSFYRDSLVVFETTARQAEGKTVYESRVIARRDFEKPQSIPVGR